MPALGAPELIIILVIIILIFGVGKLPEVGSALGKGIKEFRKNSDDPTDEQAPQPTTAAIEPPRSTPAVEAARPAPAVDAARPAPAVDAPRHATPAVEPVRPAPATVDAQQVGDAHQVEVIRPRTNGTAAYTVQSGDTLDSVAQRHGVTVEALMQANGYNQRDRVLYAGDRLQMPATTSNAS